MSEKNIVEEKVSKADFIRNWLKSNKDFSPKWMKRLFEALESQGYKVAKHDSIYVYSIKSQLEKMSKSKIVKSGRVFKGKGKKIFVKNVKENDNHAKTNNNQLYRVASLAWSLKSFLINNSSNISELKEAIGLLEYLETK